MIRNAIKIAEGMTCASYEGVYMAVYPDINTEVKIREWLKKYVPLENHPKKLHATLIYSNKPFTGCVITTDKVFKAKFKKFRIFGKNGEYLVFELDSEDLKTRHKELMQKYDFIWDYPEYIPHVTLSDKNTFTEEEIKNLEPIEGDLYFSLETVEQLDLNYKN